ncbi:protein LLP-like [Dreissena polymorpha]|uniref:Uncharacterized protein n=1 Tax=Dreissena polymorpha TaxID=45954 RepID=A0A9D4RYS9_DREPO|nr:protein LLP-like [Dreissena polymorpha]KAH3886079.1 hypothetical protein DPMN_010080 [Dreissena polymorpha]
MAKSLRSKHRRRMRSVKREKYGKKQIEILKSTLANAVTKDVEMKELCTVKTAAEVKAETAEKMETNQASTKYNPKTLKNEHGNYPVWVNQRKIKKVKKQQQKKAKQTLKNKKK